MDEVLASIRALVSEETSARGAKKSGSDVVPVLMLTPQMRIDDQASGLRSGEVLTEGLAKTGRVQMHGAPILDEEALRGVVNEIVREELQGELGDRISRNLRKLIRQEITAALAESRAD